MKPYGVRLGEQTCCPGHDKYPATHYATRHSRREHARLTAAAHRRERRGIRAHLRAKR